jgi:hypothetical protein
MPQASRLGAFLQSAAIRTQLAAQIWKVLAQLAAKTNADNVAASRLWDFILQTTDRGGI